MLAELKQYAKDHGIPIICDDGLLFLRGVFEKQQIKTVIEIGTAIGYSAIFMVEQGAEVITYERNPKMIELARKNLVDYNKKITLVAEDALISSYQPQMADLLFIDAAKAQYQKFFEKFTPYLNEGGIVVCDNLNFHHLDPNKVNRNTRQLLKKISEFKSYLKNNELYETTFYEVGDGMSISRKLVSK